MLSILAVVFIAAFLLIVLVLLALSPDAQRDVKQTRERFEAIAGRTMPAREPEVINILKEEELSDIAWLNELLHSFNIFPAMRKALRQANMDWEIGNVLLMSAALWAVGAILLYLRSGAIIISLVLGAVLAPAPWLYIWNKRKKRFMEFEEKLPEALDLIVSAIRAGHGFTSAIGLAARESSEPIAGEFRTCYDEQNFGLDLRRALTNLADRVPIPDVQLIVSAVLIQKESGGNLAEILEKVAYIIRERFRLKRQIRVHTAQGRMTGWILAFAPMVFGVILYLLNPERMAVLWRRPIGVDLLWAALIMDIIGAFIIRKIVRARV